MYEGSLKITPELAATIRNLFPKDESINETLSSEDGHRLIRELWDIMAFCHVGNSTVEAVNIYHTNEVEGIEAFKSIAEQTLPIELAQKALLEDSTLGEAAKSYVQMLQEYYGNSMRINATAIDFLKAFEDGCQAEYTKVLVTELDSIIQNMMESMTPQIYFSNHRILKNAGVDGKKRSNSLN